MSLFEQVPLADPDPIFFLNASYKADTDAKKVNLGIGAYRTDEGKPWVLPAVKKAERKIVEDASIDHEYLPIEGLTSFTQASARFILGAHHPVIQSNSYTAVQAVSGTGAVRYGAELCARFFRNATVYVSDPTWPNHFNIFADTGLKVGTYRYWNGGTNSLDLDGMLQDLRNAADGSVVVLHACAHNPTGVDPTPEQWHAIADVIAAKKHVPFFDSAYQGFASGNLEKDAYAVRYFASRGLELLVAQSYSKNFGLYSERCGCLVVVAKTQDLANRIRSQLARIARPMISNPPAYGARIVDTVLNTPELYAEWESNLKTMANRIILMRQRLFEALKQLKTPGDWSHIVSQIGMFSYTGLTKQQVKCMREKFHVYMAENGRISMAGLNSGNIQYFAESIDFAVRQHPKSQL